ncbi:MAG TPA: hypothetical protein VGO90_12015 [Chthoniobacteraceae bacterium]|jgi:hypothetical protein|nr:hypothetical protein [Chthoniobacter sp.]HEV7868401.1 hypothetical protein [Chthoniobacteraceae bacterium]
MLKLIREYLLRVPFTPFEVHATNGNVFRIEHPENAAVVGSVAVIALPDGESVTNLSALHIGRVTGLQEAEV